MKTCDICLMFAQNIDHWYTLIKAVLTNTHSHKQNEIINAYPCKPQYYYIKAGCKGVYITRACHPGVIRRREYIYLNAKVSQPFYICFLQYGPC